MVFFKEKVGDILTSKIGMPSNAIPYRREASLGGKTRFRDLSGTDDCSYIVLGRVTKVYFKQGKLDFKITNTADNIVASMGGDGTCSAPIPVDFFGHQADGTPFGHYRRVAVGDLVSVAFLNGHRSTPIILGVYPDTSDSYEIISPSLYEDGDTSDSTIAETALADQIIQPSGQIEYRSGSGSIYKALNGHSFLAVGNENEAELNKLWYRYSNVGHFYVDGKIKNPLHEEAGDWLLVHENNTDSDVDDNHITRFFVNSSGAFEVALFDATMSGSFSVLHGSKDEGFTITRYYDVESKKSGDLNNPVEEPDLDNAPTYVKFTLGNDNQGAVIEATTKGLSTKQSSKLEVNPDGVYLNDELLISGKTQSSITDNKIASAIDSAVNKINGDLNNKFNNYQKQLSKDLGDIKQIADNARDVGESASQVGDQAKRDAEDLKNNMRYYMSISPESNGTLDKSGNYSNAWTNIFKDVYIKDNYSLKITASNIEAGTLEAHDITVKNLKLTEALGNHISANIIDTGTLHADVIEANTISTNKLNAPELSQISTMLGDIKGGSLAIGKVDSSGNNVEPYNKIEYSGQTWSQSNITSALDASITNLMKLTDFNQHKGKQVAVSCQVTINGYSGVVDTGNPSIKLVFKGSETSYVDADVTKMTVSTGTYISTISYSLDIPSDGLTDIRIKSNIKANSIVLSNVVLTAYNDNYLSNTDAFYVDSAGNLTAHNITAKNGDITGVTVTASTINGGTVNGTIMNASTINGGTVNGTIMNASTINGGTVNGTTMNASIINGTNINGSLINSASKSYSSIGPFNRESLTNHDIFQTKSSNFRVLKNGTISLSKRLPLLVGENKVQMSDYEGFGLQYLYTIEARSSVADNLNYMHLLPVSRLSTTTSGVSLASGLDLNAYTKYCVINTPNKATIQDNAEADLAISNATLCIWSDSDIAVDSAGVPKDISRTDLDGYYTNFSNVGFGNNHYFSLNYPNSYFYANRSSISEIPIDDIDKMLYVSDTTHAINSSFMPLYDEISIPGSKLRGKTGNLWLGFLVTPPVGNGSSNTQQPVINILSDFEYFNGWLGDMSPITQVSDMNHETNLSILPDGTISFNMEQPTGRDVDIRTFDLDTNGNLTLTSRSYKIGAVLDTTSTTITGDGISFSRSVEPSMQQRLSFNGDPNTGNGIWFDSYGNLHAMQSSGVWRIYDKDGNDIFHVNFSSGKYWSKNGSE